MAVFSRAVKKIWGKDGSALLEKIGLYTYRSDIGWLVRSSDLWSTDCEFDSLLCTDGLVLGHQPW